MLQTVVAGPTKPAGRTTLTAAATRATTSGHMSRVQTPAQTVSCTSPASIELVASWWNGMHNNCPCVECCAAIAWMVRWIANVVCANNTACNCMALRVECGLLPFRDVPDVIGVRLWNVVSRWSGLRNVVCADKAVCSGVIVCWCGLSVCCCRPVIRGLYLSGNQLSGSIPDSIGNLTSLTYVCGMLCRDGRDCECGSCRQGSDVRCDCLVLRVECGLLPSRDQATRPV